MMKKVLVTLFSICLIMILAINVSAASVTYYQTNKADVAIWSDSNSKSTKLDTIAKSGTVLKVVSSTTNSSGNLWYKLDNGRWVWSGHVTKHSHSYNNGGICTGRNCGYEWPYTIESCSGTYQVVNSGGAKAWSRPYSNNSTHCYTHSYGAKVTVNGKTKNREGNIWYRLSDGRWVWSGNIKQCYNISYNANGGSGAPGSQTAVNGESLKISSTKPTRVGYTFQGWSKSSGSSSVSYNPGGSYKFTSNTTLYAVWKSCSHDYDKNGGFCNKCNYEYPLNVTSISGEFVIVNNNGTDVWSKPYSTGSSKLIRHQSKGSVVNVSGKVSNAHGNLWYKLTDGNWIYAGHLKQRYIINFNANGGINAPASQTTVDGESLKISSTKPTRVGYTFQGWSKSSGSSSVSYNPGGSYKFTSNTTLYAVWKTCSHDYDKNGGFCNKCNYEYPLKVESLNATFKVVSDGGAKVWSKPYSTGKSVHVRTEPKNAVVTVVGKAKNAHGNLWYKISDGNWMFSDYIKKSITITYDSNGGTGGPGSQSAVSGSSTKISTTKPNKVGYTFQGWSKSSGSSSVSYNAGGSYKFTSNTTLYAVWKTCKHNYKSNGGVCKTCKQEYNLKVSATSGTFVVTAQDGTKVWSKPYSTGGSKDIRTEKKNATLAVVGKTTNADNNVWYKLSDGNWVYSGNVTQRFTVKYEANNGQGGPKSKTYLKGNKFTVSTDKPTRVGYIFKGWSTSKNAEKVSHKAGSSYSFTKDMTLYAVWEKCTHKNTLGDLYVGGICEKCGYEYPLKPTSVTGKVKVTNADGASIWSRPYSNNSKKVRTEKKNKVLSITEKVKNQEGKTWYKISDGNWVYSGNVTRQYTVTYNLNGGTGTFKSQSFLSGKSITISKTKPTLSGYKFLGWDTSKDAMKVVYKPGAKYSKKADVTLYAVWSENGVDPIGMSEYYLYRSKVESINKIESVGQPQDKEGWKCTWTSMATILRRKQILLGETPTFTRDGVYDVNSRMVYEFRYYSSTGKEYSVKTRSGGISDYELVELLKKHPEGVWIYVTHPSNVHAIVITDYLINSDNSIQFYADDPVSNRDYNKGRVRLEETWLYSVQPNVVSNIFRICYIE